MLWRRDGWQRSGWLFIREGGCHVQRGKAGNRAGSACYFPVTLAASTTSINTGPTGGWEHMPAGFDWHGWPLAQAPHCALVCLGWQGWQGWCGDRGPIGQCLGCFHQSLIGPPASLSPRRMMMTMPSVPTHPHGHCARPSSCGATDCIRIYVTRGIQHHRRRATGFPSRMSADFRRPTPELVDPPRCNYRCAGHSTVHDVCSSRRALPSFPSPNAPISVVAKIQIHGLDRTMRRQSCPRRRKHASLVARMLSCCKRNGRAIRHAGAVARIAVSLGLSLGLLLQVLLLCRDDALCVCA